MQKIRNYIKKIFLIKMIYHCIKDLFYIIFYKSFICRFFYDLKIEKILNCNKRYTLVICHNGGGGTITYLNNKYAGENDVIVLKNHISGSRDFLYSIENFESHEKKFIKPKDIQKLTPYIEKIKIVSLESFMSIENLFFWMSSQKKYISYDMHDFHCIWFYAHLVQNDKFLTEEDIKNAFFYYAFKKISYEKWHMMWKSFFPAVEEVFAFSESSKKIFSDFFPEFLFKVKVTPHSLAYINCGKLKGINEKFSVGIFGSIRAADKGCYIVKDFLNFSKNSDYEIHINGELNEKCKIYADNIFYEGTYKVSEIDRIIRAQKISVVFFPSIWPETFSYLVSELIYAGIPVACFNLGAQAEKVSHYAMGEIIEDFNSSAVLAALKKAHKKGLLYYEK